MKFFVLIAILFLALLGNSECSDKTQFDFLRTVNTRYYEPKRDINDQISNVCIININNLLNIYDYSKNAFEETREYLTKNHFLEMDGDLEFSEKIGSILKSPEKKRERVLFVYGLNLYYKNNFKKELTEKVNNIINNEMDEMSMNELLASNFFDDLVGSTNMNSCSTDIFKPDGDSTKMIVPEIARAYIDKNGACVAKWSYKNNIDKNIFIPRLKNEGTKSNYFSLKPFDSEMSNEIISPVFFSQNNKDFFSHHHCDDLDNVTWNLWMNKATFQSKKIIGTEPGTFMQLERIVVDYNGDSIPDICQSIYYHLDNKEEIEFIEECKGKDYENNQVTDCDSNLVPDNVQYMEIDTKKEDRISCNSPICNTQKSFYNVPLECLSCKSEDKDNNGVLDICQNSPDGIKNDCNKNGLDDSYEISLNPELDLDNDGKIDSCIDPNESGQCWVSGICYNSTYSKCSAMSSSEFIRGSGCVRKISPPKDGNKLSPDSTEPEPETHEETHESTHEETHEETHETTHEETHEETHEITHEQTHEETQEPIDTQEEYEKHKFDHVLGSCISQDKRSCEDEVEYMNCDGDFSAHATCIERKRSFSR